MKRFMVFCRSIYYPSGGMKDFDNDFDDIFEAIRYGQNLYYAYRYQWLQVYDLEKKDIVYEKTYSDKNFDLEREQFLKTNPDLLQV